TTAGSYMLVKSARPAVIPFVPRRKADGTGYELIILEDISDTLQGGDKASVATQMNRAIERAVMMAPEQYMWLHRRFKTRPEGQPDRYKRKKQVVSSARTLSASDISDRSSIQQ
ncbi:TPA: lipid A biosynthesis lauroyl acyltransferase, partial [Enterobacter hormaechei subsp. xiangfangensis]|nr:lipid A biosynthesis lauroyl acyltransferase [Enterobacter hormaechei subsp. xiangfangensis]